MSEDEHVELSPLHRLMTRIRVRREADEETLEFSHNPHTRSEADVRVATYKLVEAEIRHTITEVAKDQVDRIQAARARAVLKTIKPV